MSISRSPKSPQNTYTKASNSFIYDCRLSLKSKALLLFVLSKPDSWIFNYRDVLRFNSDGIKSVRNSIRELSSFGYLIIFQSHRPNGDFDYSQYMFFETTKNLNPTKTDTPAHSPFGHALKAYAPAAHALDVLTPNNKIKKLLREETSTSSTKVVNTNVAVVSPDYKKKHKLTYDFLKTLGVINQNTIIKKYGLNNVISYSRAFKDSISKADNPTGFLVTSIKEKWTLIPQNDDKPKLIVQTDLCLSCSTHFYYLDFKHTRNICSKCEKKGE